MQKICTHTSDENLSTETRMLNKLDLIIKTLNDVIVYKYIVFSDKTLPRI